MIELVGKADKAVDAIKMTGRWWQIHRLDRIAAEEMKTVKCLTKANEVLEIFFVTGLETAPNVSQRPPMLRLCSGFLAWSV